MNEIIFLVIMTLNSTGNSWVWNYHQMASMKECYECVEHAKIAIPYGGDAEAAVVMYCSKNKVKTQKTEDRYKD